MKNQEPRAKSQEPGNGKVAVAVTAAVGATVAVAVAAAEISKRLSMEQEKNQKLRIQTWLPTHSPSQAGRPYQTLSNLIKPYQTISNNFKHRTCLTGRQALNIEHRTPIFEEYPVPST